MKHRTPLDFVRFAWPRDLAEWMAASERWRQDQAYFQQLVPPDLRPFCKLEKFKKGTVFVVTDTAAHALRLRAESQSWLQALEGLPSFTGVKKIKIQIDPELGSPPPPAEPSPKRVLSTNSALLLSGLAQEIASPRLAEALRRLASRATS